MSKPTILIDLDDTIVEVNKNLIQNLNEEFNEDYELENITCFNYYESFPEEQAEYMYDQWLREDLYESDDVQWKEGAKSGLSELRKNFEVLIVSKPMTGHASSKLRWIREHEEYFDGYVLTNRKDMVVGDLLVDDSPNNLENFHSDIIVVDQPYNQHIEDYHRAYYWGEIVDCANEILLSSEVG